MHLRPRTTLAALLACILLFADAPLMADVQPRRIEFEELSIDDGLSQSIVECIAQDETGFLWFGTEDGLNKYDGYGFTVIRNDPDDPNSLSYNHIQSIQVDSEGFIWIGTFHGGLNRYDPNTGRFTRFVNDPDDALSISHNKVNAIVEDDGGVIWLGTERGLNAYDPERGSFTRYMHDPGNPGSISGDLVLDLFVDGAGDLWIGTGENGLNRLDRERGIFVRYVHDPNDPTSIGHNSIRAIAEDGSGRLWIGTVGGGLNRFDRAGETFVRYRHDPSDPGSLSHDQVYAIRADGAGNLWIGTNGGGLNRLDLSTGRFERFLNDPQDPTTLSYNEIYDIFEDHAGVIWIGTYGGGVNKLDTNKKNFIHYKADPNNLNSLSESIVWSICEDGDGKLWIGTHGGGLNVLDRRTGRYTFYRHDPDDPASISNDIVRNVYIDGGGEIWVGTHGGGLCRFDRAAGTFQSYTHDPADPGSISMNEIRSIYGDRRGTLWIGTYGAGLNRFDERTGTFMHFRHDPGDPNSLSNDFMRFTFEDSKGRFWVGTQGGGLNLFDRDKGTFIRYQTDPDDSTSISGDYVFAMYEDGAGILWIATMGGGLNRYDPATGVFDHYTEDDGLSNNSVYGILADERGNLWLSTNYGLSKFDPRTETFKNYTKEDGLQSNEFNGGSFFKSSRGEFFFGGINGFNSFFPADIKDNPHIPPVVVTSFQKLNREVELERPIWRTSNLELSYRDYVFSFEFASLDYTAPLKNLYAYKLEGLHDEWVHTDSKKRFATFTTLPPGKYTFRVKGSNNDGLWNEEGTSIAITILPPFWRTAWFKALVSIIVIALIAFWYRWHLGTVRVATELQAAHNAQMSIMPNDDPSVDGFDISGVCIPANEVGGDFFDYIWLDEEHSKFVIAVGDVSGKAMQAAMIAVMSSGMINSKAHETQSTAEIMTELNRPLYMKTKENMYTALCLVSLDTHSQEFVITNAGFNPPLLKSGAKISSIDSEGPHLPLGAMSSARYTETRIPFKRGDVLVLFSDGIPDARNRMREFYDRTKLIRLLEGMNTSSMTAGEIKQLVIDDVMRFSGRSPQVDDMTIVVVKSTGEARQQRFGDTMRKVSSFGTT